VDTVRVNHLKVSHLGLAVRVAWEAVCGFSKVVVQKVLESPRLLSRILTGAAQNFSVLPVHEALYLSNSEVLGNLLGCLGAKCPGPGGEE